MESSQPAHDAAAQLAQAEGLRTRIAGGLRLPTGFHVVLGSSVAVQMATAAVGVAAQTGLGLTVVLVGCAQFAVVALVLSWRFRVVNGAWVGGVLARSVLGMTTTASWAYGVPFALAVWAALAGHDWLAVLVSVAGGTAYAAAGRRWWAAYGRDPAGHAEGYSATVFGAMAVVTVAGVAVLIGLGLSR
jgi:hypothetical protein